MPKTTKSKEAIVQAQISEVKASLEKVEQSFKQMMEEKIKKRLDEERQGRRSSAKKAAKRKAAPKKKAAPKRKAAKRSARKR